MSLDVNTSIWYNNYYYRQKLELLMKRSKDFKINNVFLKTLINFSQKIEKKINFPFLFYTLSIFLRLMCIFVILFILRIMVYETDSWVPLINLIFCFGIFIDLVYFMIRKKEHIGYFFKPLNINN